MVGWFTADRRMVASVAQGVRRGPNGLPQSFYEARAGGEAIPKDRFKCATDQIERWLLANGIVATKQMM
jgi:hypothetical protein